jgi:Cupin
VKGACWLAVDGEGAPLRLETGDVFVVPAERSFVLASDLKVRQLDGRELFSKATDNAGKVGVGNDFFAIGGHVALDHDRGGVVAEVLPPLIQVDGSSSEASTIRWLLDQLVKEVTANRPGAVLASKQLAQLLFVQIIRFYLAASEPLTTGWLRALNDARIAPALRLMHGEPGRAWRLGELAKQLVCHEPVLRCASKPTPVLARSRTCRTCESALRSVGFVKGRCQSLNWPSPWAMQQTAHSAMPSNERPAWHPNTTNLYLQEWMNRPHATCVNPPSGQGGLVLLLR